MAKRYSQTIPSTFTLLDSRVSDEDQYVDTWLGKTFADNHNFLLGKRCRRNILGQMTLEGTDPGDGLILTSLGHEDVTRGDYIFYGIIPITFGTKELRIKVTYDSANSCNATIYPVLHAMGRPRNVLSDYKLEFDGLASFEEVVIPVPLSTAHGRIGGVSMYYLGLLLASTMTTTTLLGSTAITNARPDAISASGASMAAYLNHAIQIDTDSEAEPRKIVRVNGTGAGTWSLFTEFPFNKVPVPGTDTFKVRELEEFIFTGIDVIEEPVTTFSFNTVWL